MEPTPSSSNVSQVRVCILHKGNGKLSKKARTDILPFNEKNWLVVKSAATYRRQKPNFATSVCFDVVVGLPEHLAQTNGYHASCYKSFTAIQSISSVTEAEKSDAHERNSPHLRSSTPTTTVDDNVKSSTSAHLLPAFWCSAI